MSQAMTYRAADPPPARADALESLEHLFCEHRRRVYRAAFRVTGNATDAEDVLQTIFLRLLRREEDVDLGETAASYLYRAAINAGLDLLRSRRRARAIGLEEAGAEVERHDSGALPGPERGIERRELHERLRSALATLNPRAAEVFTLRYFEGLGNTEIAQLLGTSRSTVAVTLHRTRHRLKKELGKSQESPS